MARRLILIAAALVGLAGVGVAGAYAQPTEPRFVLTGVVFVEGGTGGRAWLQEPNLTQNQVVTVRPGDSIGPYRLASIHEDRVELQGPNGKVVVPLAGVSGPATAAAPRPPAAAQMGALPADARPAPVGTEQTVDVRTDRTKKFDFKNFPSLLGGNRH